VKITISSTLLLALTLFALLCVRNFAQTTSPPNQALLNAEFQSLEESKIIRLNNYGGKVVVLAVWATWCSPCRDLITALSELKREFGSEIQIVGLTTEPESARSDVVSFLHEKQIDFEIGWLDEKRKSVVLAGSDSIPQIFILGKDGAVARRFIGWNPENTLPGLREIVNATLGNTTT
jgi:thiol-disulfide isomerase/thioredoxin